MTNLARELWDEGGLVGQPRTLSPSSDKCRPSDWHRRITEIFYLLDNNSGQNEEILKENFIPALAFAVHWFEQALDDPEPDENLLTMPFPWTDTRMLIQRLEHRGLEVPASLRVDFERRFGTWRVRALENGAFRAYHEAQKSKA